MRYRESHERKCPTCNEWISATAPKCFNCGEYVDDNDDEDDDEPQRPRVPVSMIAGAVAILAGIGIAVYFAIK